MTDLSRRTFLKLSGLSTLTVAGATFLTGCGPAAQDSGSDTKTSTDSDAKASGQLGDGKTLRIGMEAAYAPYNWQESKESDTTIPIENVSGAYADGYDVQIAKKIAEALNMEPVAVKMEFGALVDSLSNGTIDIICAGMSVTPERAQSADFTDSYIDDEVIMVVKKDSKYASATKLSDFTGATVLGQKDTFYDELIDEIPEVNHLTPVATVPLVVDGIENGTCDAITFSSMSLPNLLQNYPDLMKVELEDGESFSDPSNPDNAAIAKGQLDAKKHMFSVPRVRGTITHPVQGHDAAGTVLLRPAAPGTGVIAGGSVRAVMECAGITDVLTKSMGSATAVNVVRATVDALKQLEEPEEIAARRGLALDEVAPDALLRARAAGIAEARKAREEAAAAKAAEEKDGE